MSHNDLLQISCTCNWSSLNTTYATKYTALAIKKVINAYTGDSQNSENHLSSVTFEEISRDTVQISYNKVTKISLKQANDEDQRFVKVGIIQNLSTKRS